VEKYPTYEDRKSFYRLPTRYQSIQANDYSKDYPIILTTGHLTKYEGGGDETRSNPWLAELRQDMFAEINQRDANNAGVRDGSDIWVATPEGARIKVKALVTERVASGVAFKRKKRQLDETNVDSLVTGCANCRIVIEEGLEHFEMDVAVTGLTKIIAEHLKEPDKPTA